ncbi:hypothetical protein ILUMI_12950 [Ignelater luminosus]|uniref:Peptidase S1 domain-containing protein n=1 Tax=Ignelater luminosus TaxID=2038154 RepID=A0A8K0CXJ6_IGNLU|nr:hypothetical protein ILUMI_12950 [Ignelater luminosus]
MKLTVIVHLLLVISLFITIASASIKKTNSINKIKWDGKIVGGTNAQRYEFPSLVSYQTINGEHLCGGSILTQYWVLTAAHCLIAHRPYETRIVAGMLNQKEVHSDIQIIEVYEQVIHPYYPGGTEAAPNDIGLLHLAWPLQWTYAVLPVQLPYENEESFGYAWTAGWGYLSSSLPVIPTRMQKTEMLLLSYTQCANDLISLVGSIGPLNQNMICGRGAYTGTESICKGDSGGPLLQNGKVIGVTSWTLEPCGYYNVPSVYTKVSKYIQFIRYYVPGV